MSCSGALASSVTLPMTLLYGLGVCRFFIRRNTRVIHILLAWHTLHTAWPTQLLTSSAPQPCTPCRLRKLHRQLISQLSLRLLV